MNNQMESSFSDLDEPGLYIFLVKIIFLNIFLVKTIFKTNLNIYFMCVRIAIVIFCWCDKDVYFWDVFYFTFI